MSNPRICTIIPAWGRSEMLPKVIGALVDAGQNKIVFAVSPDDPEHEDVLRAIHPCPHVTVQNRPMSNKWIAAAKRALQCAWEWEYLCVLGSDDLVSPNFFDAYPWEGIGDCFGWEDCYFHEGGQLYHWRGYGSRRKESIGAGRVYSRALVEWLDGELWPQGLDRNLDYGQRQLLKERRVAMPYAPLPEDVYLVDVKDELSVSKLSDYRPEDLTPVEVPDWLTRFL